MSKPKGTMHKPGQKAPESGQYGVVGLKGGKTGLRQCKRYILLHRSFLYSASTHSSFLFD
jgi:hypothetical protein